MPRTTKPVSQAESPLVGQEIALRLGGAVAHSAVVVRMLHARCAQETEQAVCLTLSPKHYLWLPKKALREVKTTNDRYFQLQPWCRFTNLQLALIEKYQTISGVSNA